MSDKVINVAMIGLGFGAEFIPIYQAHANANVYAVCRRNEEELNKVADQLGIEKRYTDYDAVLADPEVDFVHINSPIGDHAWMSLKALDAGKHVRLSSRWSSRVPRAPRTALTSSSSRSTTRMTGSAASAVTRRRRRRTSIGWRNAAPCSRTPTARRRSAIHLARA